MAFRQKLSGETLDYLTYRDPPSPQTMRLPTYAVIILCNVKRLEERRQCLHNRTWSMIHISWDMNYAREVSQEGSICLPFSLDFSGCGFC